MIGNCSWFEFNLELVLRIAAKLTVRAVPPLVESAESSPSGPVLVNHVKENLGKLTKVS